MMLPSARPALQVIRGNGAIPQRREFDHLGRLYRPGILAQRVGFDEVPILLGFAAREIPFLSSAIDAVNRVINRNRDGIWVFRRGERAVGVYAMLHLSSEGMEALLLGEFNTTYPDPSLIVNSNEKPAAVYKWAVVAPAMAASGICAMSRLLQADRFATANLYARPMTSRGGKIMAHLGFKGVRSGFPDLQRYVRIINRESGLVDGE
jgi:hypothetical protein